MPEEKAERVVEIGADRLLDENELVVVEDEVFVMLPIKEYERLKALEKKDAEDGQTEGY